MRYLILVVIFFVGFAFGFLVATPRANGVFKIDTSDPEKDVYSLELTDPIDTIEKRKRLLFIVKKDA